MGNRTKDIRPEERNPSSAVSKTVIPKAESLEDAKIVPDRDTKPLGTFDLDEDNLLKLSTDDEQALVNTICDEIKNTVDKEAGLRHKLRLYHRMYEQEPDRGGVNFEQKHFKLGDDPGIRSIYAASAVKGKVARYMMSMFSSPPYVLIKLERAKQKVQIKVQKYAHFALDKLALIKNRYREIFMNASIENMCASSVVMDVDRDPVIETRTYTSEADFRKDFPNPKKAGVTPEEYNAYLLRANTEADQGGLKIQTRFFKITKIFPTVEPINREDFGLIPAYSTFKTAQGKFQRLWMRYNDIAREVATGKYKNLMALRKRTTGGEPVPGSDEVNKDIAKREGIDDSEKYFEGDYKTKSYEVFRTLYWYYNPEKGFDDLIIATISYKERVALRLEFWDNNWFVIPHYIEKKSGRAEGIGTVEKVRNIVLQGDDMINLRMKIGKMVTSPSFKAKKGSDFDPGIQKWYPGCIWWLDEMDEVEQWVITSNFPELYQEEAALDRKQEVVTGMSSGLSGQELPQDPSAPGNKTIALIRESNVLINEDIDVLRESVEQVFYCIFKMAAKYLPADDKYLAMYGVKKEDIVILKEQISLHGISVSNNAEVEKQEADIFFDKARTNPLLANNPQVFRKLTENWIAAWGRDPEEILPSEEEMMEYQIKIQMEATKRLRDEDAFRKKLRAADFSEEEIDQKLEEFNAAQERDQGGAQPETGLSASANKGGVT